MRKPLKSAKKQQEQKTRNSRIIGITLLIILMASVFGLFANSFGEVSDSTSSIDYNGHKFFLSQGFYVTDAAGPRIYLSSHPKSISRLEYDKNFYFTITDYLSEPLYIVSESSELSSEINNNLKGYVQRSQYACLEGEVCKNKDYPIKNCEDRLIVIQESTSNEITQDNNCIFIKGKEQDLLSLVDRFILEVWGIK